MLPRAGLGSDKASDKFKCWPWMTAVGGIIDIEWVVTKC